MYTRRELRRYTLAGFASSMFGPLGQIVSGVRLGVCTNSFRALPRKPGIDDVDTLIHALTECDVRECELSAPQVEPRFGGSHGAAHRAAVSVMSPQMMRRELRKWRLRTPLDHFRTIGDKFKQAGIDIHAYNYSPNSSFTNEEIDRGFGMAKALGAEIITASTTLDVAKRIVPFADKHQMVVAIHSQSPIDNSHECATPDSLAAAMQLSKYFAIDLDLGHFTACNLDAVAYIRQRHAGIASLRLNDRRKHQGDNLPWGQGDTPIREVLQLLKREAWPIRAYVEYAYPGQSNPVDEVRKCLAYAKQALMNGSSPL
jgi:sugar phosphate isomerase/epimerase